MFGLFNDDEGDIQDFLGQALNAINAASNQAIADLDKYVTTGIKEGEESLARSGAIAAPFSEVATRTMNELASFLGIQGSDGKAALTGDQVSEKLTTLPGYQFQFAQGQKALERSQAQKGILGEGRAAKELVSYGQGFASQMYGEHLNRLSGLLGQTSVFPQQQMISESSFGAAKLGTRAQQGAAVGDIRMNAGAASANAIMQAGILGMNQRNTNRTRTDAMLGGLGSIAGQVIGGFL